MGSLATAFNEFAGLRWNDAIVDDPNWLETTHRPFAWWKRYRKPTARWEAVWQM